MKISSVGLLNLNRTQNKNLQSRGGQVSDVMPQTSEISYAYVPYQVHFGYTKIPKEIEIISKLKDMPCPCCGHTVITRDEFKLFQWPKNKKVLSASYVLQKIEETPGRRTTFEKEVLSAMHQLKKNNPGVSYDELSKNFKTLPPIFEKYVGKYIELSPVRFNAKVISMMKTFEDKMHPIEKEVFDSVKYLHAKYPEKSLKDLLLLMRPDNIEKLQSRQFKILDEINIITDELKPDEAFEIKNLLKEGRENIKEDNTEDPFKRKWFLSRLRKKTAMISDSNIKANILKKAYELPRSQKDVSAFIVKYSGMALSVDKKTGRIITKERENKAIAKAFIENAVSSLEHVVSKGSIRSRAKKHNPKILTFECKGCNDDKKADKLFNQVKMNPQMPENTQKYFDKLVEKSNAGELNHSEWYIEDLADTFVEESKGLITPDISKLENTADVLDIDGLVKKFNSKK